MTRVGRSSTGLAPQIFWMLFWREEITLSNTSLTWNSLYVNRPTQIYWYIQPSQLIDQRANKYGSTGSFIHGANASTHMSHIAPFMPIDWSVNGFLHSPHRLVAAKVKKLKCLMSSLRFVVSSFSYIALEVDATISWLLACQTLCWIFEGHLPASFRKWLQARRGSTLVAMPTQTWSTTRTSEWFLWDSWLDNQCCD